MAIADMENAALERVTTAPRTLPHSLEAERSVLGGILLNPTIVATVADMVAPADFYHPAHVPIMQAILDLHSVSKPVDPITVAEQMRISDTIFKLKGVNGEHYFTELTSSVVTIENIAYHARMVSEKAAVRKMIETAQEIAAAGYSSNCDPDEFLEQSQAAVMKIAFGGRSALVSIEDSVTLAVKAVERACDRRAASGGHVVGVPTGFSKLDRLTGGWPDEYVIVAASTSTGKTSFAMDCVAAAAKQHMPCLVISREMTHEQLTMRELAKAGGIDSWRLRTGNMRPEDWTSLWDAARDVRTLPITFDDGVSGLRAICSTARSWRTSAALGGRRDLAGEPMRALVVIDYLQLVPHTASRKNATKEQEIAEISRAMAGLPKALRCPVMVLSQLSRQHSSRPDKRPILSDLRESGSLEQDADIVAFLYRDEAHHKDTKEPGIAEVIIAKNRNGKTGTVRLGWQSELTRFYDLTDDDARRTAG